MYLPFCSLLMKIMKHEGVCPRKDEKIIVCHCPISIASLQKSKIYPQHQRVNLFNMSLTQVMAQLLTLPLDISRLHLLIFLSLKQLALCQDNLASHIDQFTTLVESLHERVSGLSNAIYSTNNQIQMRLTAIET